MSAEMEGILFVCFVLCGYDSVETALTLRFFVVFCEMSLWLRVCPAVTLAVVCRFRRLPADLAGGRRTDWRFGPGKGCFLQRVQIYIYLRSSDLQPALTFRCLAIPAFVRLAYRLLFSILY